MEITQLASWKQKGNFSWFWTDRLEEGKTKKQGGKKNVWGREGNQHPEWNLFHFLSENNSKNPFLSKEKFSLVLAARKRMQELHLQRTCPGHLEWDSWTQRWQFLYSDNRRSLMTSSDEDIYVCLDYSDLELTRKGKKLVDMWGNRTLWKCKAISNFQLTWKYVPQRTLI